MIYLDYNATTPVDDRVLTQMLPWFTERFANAASSHEAGQEASSAVEAARKSIADLVGAQRGEIFFTSGATEANNLALRGLLPILRSRPRLLVGATEHLAVLDTARELGVVGIDVLVLPVTANGLIDEAAYVRLLDDRVGLVSIMWANNETGVIAPVDRLAALRNQLG